MAVARAWRRARLGSGLAGLVVLLALAASPARAGTPFPITSDGQFPSVAVDAAGTAHVVFNESRLNENSLSEDRLHYCQILPRATTCTKQQTFVPPDRGYDVWGPRVFITSAGSVVLLASRCCLQNWIYVSTGGGEPGTFGAPRAVGNLEPRSTPEAVNSAILDEAGGQLLTISPHTGGNVAQAAALASGFETQRAQLGTGQQAGEGSIVQLGPKSLLTAFQDVSVSPPRIITRRFTCTSCTAANAAAGVNDATKWEAVRTVATGRDTGLVAGPSGTFLVSLAPAPGGGERYVVRKYVGPGFAPSVPVSAAGAGNRAFFQDDRGVLWFLRHEGGRLVYSTSETGASWSAKQDVHPEAFVGTTPQVAAHSTPGGPSAVAVFDRAAGGNHRIDAVALATPRELDLGPPAPAPAPPPGGALLCPQSSAEDSSPVELASSGAKIAAVRRFGAHGTGPGQLCGAAGLAVDPAGNLFVADADNGRVQKFDRHGFVLGELGRGVLSGPQGVAAGPDGTIYVADTGHDRIARFTPDGGLLSTFGGGLAGPVGVATTADGHVLVADSRNARVAEFDEDGKALGGFGGRTYAGGYLSSPFGVAVGPAGGVAVSDALDGSVAIFGPDHVYRNRIYARGSAFGLAVTPTSRIVVAESAPPGVSAFTTNGAVAPELDTGGVRFLGPKFAAADCRGALYVSDDRRIFKFARPATQLPPCAKPPRVTPAGRFDVQATGLEVTQGIQYDQRADVPEDDTGLPFPLPGRPDPAAPEKPVLYRGVPLQSGRATVVRFFASVREGAPGGLTGVPAVLHAFRDGKELRDSPILPSAVTDLIRPGFDFPTDRQRRDPSGAYTFDLPSAWTDGRISLRADLNPNGYDPTLNECDGPGCRQRNNTYALTEVPFRRTADLHVVPVALTTNGALPQVPPGRDLSDPRGAFGGAARVLPLNVRVEPWQGFVEVGGIMGAQTVTVERCFLGFFPCSSETRPITFDDRRELALDLVQDWADDQNWGDGDLIAGVNANDELIGGLSDGNVLFDDQPHTIVQFNRPLTSVAHELGHAIGRPHAGLQCGSADNGQVGEPWPPDDRGQIRGIGLRPPKVGEVVDGPYKLIVPGPAGSQGERDDFMSYCADEEKAWTSTTGWARAVNFNASRRRSVPRAAVATQSGRRLRVHGYVDDGGGLVLGVGPAGRRAARGPAGSAFAVEVRDAADRVLSSTPMTVSAGHGEGRPAASVTLDATVALPAGAASLDVARDGVPLAQRRRSAHPPRVRITAPKARKRLGSTGGLLVTWRTRDQDPDPRTAQVELSTDGGRRWRVVFAGPDRGRARLPARAVPRSRAARVRVRVSDGFDSATATSARFTAAGSSPLVRLLDPAPLRLRADAPLVARGEAYDDAGRRLRGRALEWFAGRRRIGRGERLTATGLPVGRVNLRLVAQDRHGRRGTQRFRVRVTAVRPLLLRFAVPARLSRRARSVVLRVATNVRARLTVAGRSVTVDRRTRRVRVRVRAGRGALALRVRVSASGKALRFTRRIPRA